MAYFIAATRLNLWFFWRRRRRAIATAAVLLGVYGPLIVIGLAIRLPVGPGETVDPVEIGAPRVRDLFELFGREGYDLDVVAAGQSSAPRAFLADLPVDWPDMAEARERKRAFIMVMLPLVLRANERIRAERRRVLAAETRRAAGDPLSRGERAWLQRLAQEYELTETDLAQLKWRVDVIPPSLAIAQAAVESGWGTSRFVGEGNALFGEWTEQDRGGMIPAGRDPGRTYAIRKFDTLGDSIASYIRNLNTHRAYRAFRARRAELRRRGEALDGLSLVETLGAYSEQGRNYIRTLRIIIAQNGLRALDRARLASKTR